MKLVYQKLTTAPEKGSPRDLREARPREDFVFARCLLWIKNHSVTMEQMRVE